MQKHNRRDLYIAGEEGCVDWNTQSNQLIVDNYKNGNKEVLSDPEYANDDMFLSQALYFLKEFQRSDKSYLDSAEATLAIVEAAKESMKRGKEIKVKINK